MNYYPEHTETENGLEGIIEITKPQYQEAHVTIDDQIYIIPSRKQINRAIHGDTVRFNPDTLQVTQLTNQPQHQQICGILDLQTNVIYGSSKKNVPRYMFQPMDWHFPPFYVSTKIPRGSKKLYAIINPLPWEPHQKYPLGQLHLVIGEVGELEHEYDAILYRYDLARNTFKRKQKRLWIQQFQPQIDELNGTHFPNTLDLRHLFTFSVDPEGCQDMDDALHFQILPNHNIQIGVHIADVSRFVTPNSDLDQIAQTRMTSVYAPHKKVSMLPEFLSEELCSLQPHKNRYTFTALHEFNHDMVYIKTTFHKAVIKSKAALTYEHAQTLLDQDITHLPNDSTAVTLHNLDHLAQHIHNYQTPDSHKMVEAFMILTNAKVAEHLVQNYPSYSILRSHMPGLSDSEEEYHADLTSLPEQLQQHLKIVTMQAATYTMDTNNSYHYGLDLSYYTHFTSPIRRYADLLIHRIMDDQQSVQDLQLTCDKINETNKKIGRADRDCQKMTLIHSIRHKKFVRTNAYVTGIVPNTKNRITLFIPQYNVSHPVQVFNHRLEQFLEYQHRENIFRVRHKQTNQVYELYLYDEVQIKIVSLASHDVFNQKLNITIEEPSTTDFIL